MNNLVTQFLNTCSAKDIRFYSIRDNCGIAALDMQSWATNQGIVLTRIHGHFEADFIVYEKLDFTSQMKKEFALLYSDFNCAEQRKQFILSNDNYKNEWRKIPHYWLVDHSGELYDPSGELQFVKKGLATDLNTSRYLPEINQSYNYTILN